MKKIDLEYLIKIFFRKWIIILCVTSICVGGSYLFGKYLVKSDYTATTSILVNSSKINDDSYNKIETNLQLINTYKVIMTQADFLRKVLKQVDQSRELKQNNTSKITLGELLNMVVVKSDLNSQIITIDVKTKNPDQSVQIANGIVNVLKKEVVVLMKEDRSIITVSEGYLDSKTGSPNKSFMLVAAFLFGILLSLIIVIINDKCASIIRSEDFYNQYQNAYFLGTVKSHDFEILRL